MGDDPRTPDIVVLPNVGVVYTGSTKKQAEHGGFALDDTNVMLLVSNPSTRARSITSFVETTQVAPTVLKLLGLDPAAWMPGQSRAAAASQSDGRYRQSSHEGHFGQARRERSHPCRHARHAARGH
jgi:hypothetical protein